MLHVDKEGKLNQYLTDPNRLIPKAHLKTVCNFKGGAKACRYIAFTPNGEFCAKHTPIKIQLDNAIARGAKGALGDNCDGFRGSD